MLGIFSSRMKIAIKISNSLLLGAAIGIPHALAADNVDCATATDCEGQIRALTIKLHEKRLAELNRLRKKASQWSSSARFQRS
ncbi:hypothetical protein, partial [Novosphingobium sp. TCA1]|uniref:hypothetical protein n=1 Tax=Novosphingobium sp. TCA1 TaxID=2682474 RepID=UPI001F357BDF